MHVTLFDSYDGWWLKPLVKSDIMYRTRQVTRSSFWRTASSFLWESRFCHMTLEKRRYYVTTCRLRAPALHRTIRPVSSPPLEARVFRWVLFKIKRNPEKMSLAGFYSQLSLSSWRVCPLWCAWRSWSVVRRCVAGRGGVGASHWCCCRWHTPAVLRRHGPHNPPTRSGHHLHLSGSPPSLFLCCCFFFFYRDRVTSLFCCCEKWLKTDITTTRATARQPGKTQGRPPALQRAVPRRGGEGSGCGATDGEYWGGWSIVTWQRWPARPFKGSFFFFFFLCIERVWMRVTSSCEQRDGACCRLQSSHRTLGPPEMRRKLLIEQKFHSDSVNDRTRDSLHCVTCTWQCHWGKPPTVSFFHLSRHTIT